MEAAHYLLGLVAYGLAFLAGSVVFFGWLNEKLNKNEED